MQIYFDLETNYRIFSNINNVIFWIQIFFWNQKNGILEYWNIGICVLIPVTTFSKFPQNFLTTFLQISHFFQNFLKTFSKLFQYFLTTFSQLSQNFLKTFSHLSCNFLTTFSKLSHNCLNIMQLSWPFATSLTDIYFLNRPWFVLFQPVCFDPFCHKYKLNTKILMPINQVFQVVERSEIR